MKNGLTLDNYTFKALAENVEQVHELTSSAAKSAVNQMLTARNWMIGYYIVKFEQNGKDRAEYGTHLLQNLADRLQIKGLDRTQLNLCRIFYQKYPQICATVSHKLQRISGTGNPMLPSAGENTEAVISDEIRATASHRFEMPAELLISRLSFSHIREIMIDYIGIVKALRKALADYTANAGGQGGDDPTVDKDELIARILGTIEKAKDFLREHDFELDDLISAGNFQKLFMLQTAANAVCGSVEDKKSFSTYSTELIRLMKYMDRDDITVSTRQEYEAIAAIYAELQKKRRHVDNSDLMVEINAIISDYVEIDHLPTVLREETRRFDISAIDFDLLRREFERVKKKNLVMRDLEELIQQKLDRLLFNNPDRINYYERYQQIITDYNSEQDRATIEKTFMELIKLTNDLDQEEQRYVREGFANDEELSFYDMLFREDLSKADIKKIKEVSASLLKKIKERIAELDHWTDKQETKAAIDNLIRDTLWAELPDCYDEISISEYRQRIYEYVYTRYKAVA